MASRATAASAERRGGPPRTGPRLVLASASQRRFELLAQVGLVPEVVPSTVAEVVPPGEPPQATARRLALDKAEEVAGRLGAERAFLIAADTVVAIDGLALGKPADRAEARAMLERLSGRTHEVHTGFVVLESGAGRRAPAGRAISGVATTRVRVKPLTPSEIAGYLATGEPFDKAGAYAIQGAGAFMIAGVEGSVTNVIGLPLVEVLEALAALGGPRPFGAAR